MNRNEKLGDAQANDCLPLGQKVIVRTVTHFHIGTLVAIEGQWLMLDDALWVANTGRWHQALEEGKVEEADPFPGRVWVNAYGVIDITPWPHDVSRENI